MEYATFSDISELVNLLEYVKVSMKESNIQQWTSSYPSKDNFVQDIENKELVIMKNEGKIVFSVAIKEINGCFELNRFMTHPDFQGKGIARDFIEEFIEEFHPIEITAKTNHTNNFMIKFLERNKFDKLESFLVPSRELFGDFYLYKRIIGDDVNV